MTVGSLFAGIGGLDLGLERAGMEVRWQVEIDDYCRKVLAKHWPDVPRYKDVRDVGAHNLESVDLICGGFPCQDISVMGAGAGIDGGRSGLWSHFFRIICELRPSTVLVENSPAITSRGLGRVLGDLAEVGYDAEWDCIPAGALGARHQRFRAFVVAYPAGERLEGRNGKKQGGGRSWLGASPPTQGPVRWDISAPAVLRTTDGVPYRVDRTRALGNAVVPQVAEWIGRWIMEAT